DVRDQPWLALHLGQVADRRHNVEAAHAPRRKGDGDKGQQDAKAERDHERV
ncbi:MAG: hypothetical protein AVDCRST_MAG26-4451, partial [uncultured Chloroflexia bacterium]